MNILNRETYPVSESVIYKMIHQRHRHQRENKKNKDKPVEDMKKRKRQKHANARRSEVN